MFRRENWGKMPGGSGAFVAAYGHKGGDGYGRRGGHEEDDGGRDAETFGDDSPFDIDTVVREVLLACCTRSLMVTPLSIHLRCAGRFMGHVLSSC